ncbi:MAG TPA: UDP-3-O-(3-hydroxymyristoyl)glucosamine N-acyltransferase [Steroidobacteraceae bacterium]|jgi:UDP-3-O-[3-hydroxymyristoyl] glucosamine N-acyltransferase|nr:UDP-3-O-(3-hydroxymyristoyl)glucosamine N-acyltransferase [Steroidobacteraceae bacterium]
MSIALGEIAVRFGCELRGDPDTRVDHIAPLESAGPGAISYLANPRLTPLLASTRASAVVLDPRSADGSAVAALLDRNPHATFARIAALLYPSPVPHPGIHPSAIVDCSASVDPSAEIGPYSVIGAGARIGARCLVGATCLVGRNARIGADGRLVSRVTIEHDVMIGERVLIHPGVVIGADGFGLARDSDGWIKVPQVGSVRIGDDVEIGANTTIDRGAMDDTVISSGVKLDNQIQIGHNVFVGEHTAIAGCTGVAGSTRIGARCMIGGHVGFAGHIQICDDVVITGKSAVPHSIKQPGIYSGVVGLEPVRTWHRIVARMKLGVRREQRLRKDDTE